MIKLIVLFIIIVVLLYNSLKIVDFINKKEKEEDRINDTRLRRLIVSTLTSLFVGCLLLKYNFSIISIKYILLIVYLFICAYIDQHTQNVYTFISIIFMIIFSVFFIFELKNYINIANYVISLIGTLVIGSILGKLKFLGWGDVEVFIVISLFLGGLGFINLFNIFLSFSLSGIGAIYYLIRRKLKLNSKSALCPYILISTFIILILV